jgi:hypothetical protein
MAFSFDKRNRTGPSGLSLLLSKGDRDLTIAATAFRPSGPRQIVAAKRFDQHRHSGVVR